MVYGTRRSILAHIIWTFSYFVCFNKHIKLIVGRAYQFAHLHGFINGI